MHRIDKDTSGLLMIAKNDKARESLEKQLAEKINKREYLAIVHGNFEVKNGVTTIKHDSETIPAETPSVLYCFAKL